MLNFFTNIFLLYLKSEGWWLVNKKVANNCYSPSQRKFSFSLYGLVEQWGPTQEKRSSNPGQRMIHFHFQRNCVKISKLSAINSWKCPYKYQNCLQLITNESVKRFLNLSQCPCNTQWRTTENVQLFKTVNVSFLDPLSCPVPIPFHFKFQFLFKFHFLFLRQFLVPVWFSFFCSCSSSSFILPLYTLPLYIDFIHPLLL